MPTILVVDDEPAALTFCQRMLQMSGYTVLPASGSEAALRLFNDPQHSIDIALLDVMMPGMNGIELAARLQTSRPDLPVVLMSGYSVVKIKRIVGEHPFRIIWKPFKMDSLLRMIDNALGQSTSASA